jgi:predicted secreted hydrolase
VKVLARGARADVRVKVLAALMLGLWLAPMACGLDVVPAARFDASASGVFATRTVVPTVRATAPRDSSRFRMARGTRSWSFPHDHAAHREYATEWWYTTGIVRTAEGRLFGYEVTFFRSGLEPPAAPGEPGELPAPGRGPASRAHEASPASARSPWRARDLVLAHVALSDVARGRFLFDQRLERAAHGWAGADTAEMRVWVGDWRVAWEGESLVLQVPPESTNESFGLDLELTPTGPPVLHGAGGLSVKDDREDPHASWYVSLPRLQTRGRLTVRGQSFTVEGATWLDHEFFSGGLSDGQVGWDWFSCRLEDGRDLMLFRLRGARGETDYAAGTIVSGDGTWRAADMRGATFEGGGLWKSEGSGASYPLRWRVRLPAEGLELTSRTPLAPQEVVARDDVGFTYWEGLVSYQGRWQGEEVRGEGYVEMTGYSKPVRFR